MTVRSYLLLIKVPYDTCRFLMVFLEKDSYLLWKSSEVVSYELLMNP